MADRTVQSADGTPIYVELTGQGRPLVVVSGALFARQLWRNVIAQLADRTVCVIDRRGRGNSGDSPHYAPEREVEDVLAVLSSFSEPLDLLGHSSGAILALQAAARVPPNLERLMVYEPPVFFRAEDQIAADLPARLDALIAAGDRATAVETFLREGPRSTEQELQSLRAGRGWAPLVEHLAHTVAYDSRVQGAFSASPEELARITIPTLMLRGGASPERMRLAAETIAARLPQCTLRELPGQEHVAMLGAPALFAEALRGLPS